MAYSGQPVVDFIGNLTPLYQSEKVLGFRAARCLRNGSLILAAPDEECEPEDASVIVWWHGDPKRASEVAAYMMASTALVDYAQFHSTGHDSEHAANLLAHLSQHFEYKTGATLYLPYREEDFAFLGKILKIAKSVGPKVAWEVLRKGVGL
jgi:hypothetical protein